MRRARHSYFVIRGKLTHQSPSLFVSNLVFLEIQNEKKINSPYIRTSMETPPSSPSPASSSRNAEGDDNVVTNRNEDAALLRGATTTTAVVAPLTPDASEDMMMMMTMTTSSSSGVSSSSLSRGYHHHHHGVPIISELTPVISNRLTSADYVDTHLDTPSGSRLPHPKLTPFARDDDDDGIDGDDDNRMMAIGPIESPYYGAARGLRRRPSSSATAVAESDAFSRGKSRENDDDDDTTGLSSNDSLAGELRRSSSVPDCDEDDTDERGTTAGVDGGVGIVPSAAIAYSGGSIFEKQDDDDDDDDDNAIVGSRHLHHRHHRHPLAAPVDLLLGSPDRRKFSSFQGARQYERRVLVVDVDPRGDEREMEEKASFLVESEQQQQQQQPPPPSIMEKILSSGLMLPRDSNPTGRQQQYQPTLRNQHGVKEMAEADDLDAIFKSPRRGKEERDQHHYHVVSPHATAVDGTPVRGGAPVISDGRVPQPQQQQQQPMLSCRKEASNLHQHQQQQQQHHLLSRPYPVDERDWSIPSIRLANHVRGSDPMDSFASYADFSEYTAEDDLDGSLRTYPDDDDDSSMGSIVIRGNYRPEDATAARATSRSGRKSGAPSGIFQQRRASSSSDALALALALADRIPPTVYSQDVCDVPTTGPFAGPSSSPTMTASDSFLEKMQGISIEVDNDDNNGMCDDSEMMYPPIRDVDAIPSPAVAEDNDDDDAADADAVIRDSRPRRRRYRGGRSDRRRKEGAAVEWLQDLQDRSQNDSSSEKRGEFLIAEAASSKFLGDGVVVVGGGGGSGQRNAVPSTRATSEDYDDDVVMKALGLPHPLCRSSTIEAGPFMIRAGGVFGKSRDEGAGRRGTQLHFHLRDVDMQQDQAINTN